MYLPYIAWKTLNFSPTVQTFCYVCQPKIWRTVFIPPNQKMCDAILVTLLKVRPHHSQSSRENATWCSVTPPLASYQEDPSPNPPGEEQRHRLTFLRGIAMWIGSKCKKNGFVKNGHLRCWCDGQSEPNSTFQETRGSFLESPDNWRARKAGLVYMHDRGFNSFASNMIKLSVNEIKWSSLLARTHALILFISIWIYLILPGLSRNAWSTWPTRIQSPRALWSAGSF